MLVVIICFWLIKSLKKLISKSIVDQFSQNIQFLCKTDSVKGNLLNFCQDFSKIINIKSPMEPQKLNNGFWGFENKMRNTSVSVVSSLVNISWIILFWLRTRFYVAVNNMCLQVSENHVHKVKIQLLNFNYQLFTFIKAWNWKQYLLIGLICKTLFGWFLESCKYCVMF